MQFDQDTARRVAALIRTYTKGLTQEAIADQLSAILDRNVRQAQVSEHLGGRRWTLDWFRVYAEAFDIPIHEQHKVLGLPKSLDDPDQDELPSIRAMIAADEELTDEAKEALLAQYEIARQASRAAVTKSSPKQGRRSR